MNVFLVFGQEQNFCRLLPKESAGSGTENGRIKVMAFPPLGIQTPAPLVRQHGHQVRLFDNCYPQMQAEDITRAARDERPGVIALSCLSTTTYPAVKDLSLRLKILAPNIPLILGGPFATRNSDHILRDCRHPKGPWVRW